MNNKDNEIINKICVEICQGLGECQNKNKDPNACEKCKHVMLAWCVKRAIKKYKEKTTKGE